MDINSKKRINLLDRLDTSKCVHFRYLWIQLLATEEARRILSDADMMGDLDNLVSIGRVLYRKELINNLRKSFLRIHPNDEALAIKKATEEVDENLRKGLSSWFSVRAPEYAEWLNQVIARGSIQTREAPLPDDELDYSVEASELSGPEEIQAPGDDELKKLLFDRDTDG